MSRRVVKSTYKDPLNLVRVPKNPLQGEALSVIQTMQSQKMSMKNIDHWKDEFDEVEVNLDKWKQKRRSSFSRPNRDFSDDSPPLKPTMQSSSRLILPDQGTDVERNESGNNQQTHSERIAYSVQNPFEEKDFAMKKSFYGLNESSAAPRSKEDEPVDESLLRQRHFPRHIEELSMEECNEEAPKSTKEYARKSENRFKSTMAFFEHTSKQENDAPVRPQRNNARSNQRKSWAPGMMEQGFSTRPLSKLPIANDKEFTIEEIDLNKPRERISRTENKTKANFTPRFVPNIESDYDEILRKKDSDGGERRSRVEIISVDFEDKSAPVLSLDDFKSFIQAPEEAEIHEKKPETEREKNKIFLEDDEFKNEQFKTYTKENKIYLTEGVTRSGFSRNYENDKNEEVHNENFKRSNEFLDKKNNFKTDQAFEKPKNNYNIFEVDQGANNSNDVIYSSVRNEKLSDVLQKKIEDRRALFQSNLTAGLRNDTSAVLRAKDKPSSVVNEEYKKEVQQSNKSDNPFDEFEETYKNQLDELQERKNRDSLRFSSNVEDLMEVKKTEKDDAKDQLSFKTDYKVKESASDDYIDQNVLKKSDGIGRLSLRENRKYLEEKNKLQNANANLISLHTEKEIPAWTHIGNYDFKIEAPTKNQETFQKNDLSFEPNKTTNKEIDDTDRSAKAFPKPLPKVAPKPASRTSKIIEKLASSGFTPVLPGDVPRRSKSMKAFGTPATTVTRRIDVDEVGVDMDADMSCQNMLDTSAQKSKSSVAKSARRRPPSMYQAQSRLTKMHTFDSSNGFDSELMVSHQPRHLSLGDDEFSNSPLQPFSRPPPASNLETFDPFQPSLSPPRSTISSNHKEVHSTDLLSLRDRYRKRDVYEGEESNV